MAKQRKLINIKVIGATQTHLNEFIDENKGSLFSETFAGIKQAMRRNKSIADICNVNTTNALITLEKENWENALSSSLGYFESVDEFEKCKEISSTLKMLRNEKRPTRSIKTISGSAVTS